MGDTSQTNALQNPLGADIFHLLLIQKISLARYLFYGVSEFPEIRNVPSNRFAVARYADVVQIKADRRLTDRIFFGRIPLDDIEHIQ